MVIEKLKCVFVHIPKSGGTSIETILTDDEKVTPISLISNHEKFIGWSDKHQMWMQHATMQQLNELHEEDLSDYFKFAFVRNPWDRAISDFFWLLRDVPEFNNSFFEKANFKNFLNETDVYEEILSDKSSKSYRGDHFISQCDYIFDSSGNKLVDFVGKTENFKEDVLQVMDKLGLPPCEIPHDKKQNIKSYINYYTDETNQIVAKKYAKDIEYFNYEFGA